MSTLVVRVLFIVTLNYFSSLLTRFRAQPSADFTEFSSPVFALPGHHSCVTAQKRSK